MANYNLFDAASLAMVPVGYKENKLYSVKPDTGAGDFDFTRASYATRVNADGNIEKERENLLTYSNTFSNSAWVKLGAGTGAAAVVTSGFTDPNGGSNAWRLQCDLNGGTTSGDQSLIYQLGSGTGITTYSYYVKSNTGASQDFVFGNDLNGYSQQTATTSWQRFEVFVNSASTRNSFIGSRGTTGSDDTLDILIYAAQREQGLVATDYIETTTSAVTKGITDNVPRIDYTSGCGSLLLEPSRTNLFAYSEYFNTYYNLNAGTTLTDNYGISPEGVQNATRYLGTGTSGFGKTFTLTNGTEYTASFYVKSNTGATQYCRIIGDSSFISGDLEVTTEWTRVEHTWTSAGLASKTTGLFRDSSNNDIDILVYGAQLEAGSYPTSYIPTYGSSVTRQVEYATSDVTSLLTSNEGTLFLHLDNGANSGGYGSGALSIGLQDANSNNFVGWASNSPNPNELRGIYKANGSIDYLGASTPVNEECKLLIKWSKGVAKFFKNGFLYREQAVGQFNGQPLINYLLPNQFRTGNFPTKQTLVFSTALTDNECKALTRPYDTYQEWVDGEGLTWESKSCTTQSIIELQNI